MAEGDSAVLIGSNVATCIGRGIWQYLVYQDGQGLGIAPYTPFEMNVSPPGYNELDGTGFDNIIPTAFFIARPEAGTPVLLMAKAWLHGAFMDDAGIPRRTPNRWLKRLSFASVKARRKEVTP